MRLRLVFPIALAAALGAGTPARAGVPADPTPELDDRPDTLAVKDVRRLIKRAVRKRYSIDTSRRYRRDCSRRSRLRMRCSMRWIDHSGTRMRARVEIWRTGTYGSPTTHYRVNARGDRNGAPRRRWRGAFPTPTRRAYFGDPITLPAELDGTRVRLRVHAPRAGVSHGPIDAPRRGHALVGVAIALRTVGASAYDGVLGNDVRVVLGDRTRIEPMFKVDPPCDDTSVRAPSGAVRRVCTPFEVPRTASVARVEITLDAGTASETGHWQARPDRSVAPRRRR